MTIPTQTRTDTAETELHAAIEAFATALAETPEFHAFEEAAVVFKHDRAAQQAVRLFQEKQRSLQFMQRLGTLTPGELDELKALRQAMIDTPSVRAYVEAQDNLIPICQAAAQEISTVIGLDFANACASGCCG